MNFINQLSENLKEERFIHHFKILRADLPDMQLISKYNKRIRFLLCVIDTFSIYAWAVPLKDKKGATIANAFQKVLDNSKRKPNKIWVDQGRAFYNNFLKSG